ncbi:MAG TPA: insulinase family protein [Thermoanaerobaculia bacterium]|nr:insulinase family protein [Thermoanaerobaculia bacterium]
MKRLASIAAALLIASSAMAQATHYRDIKAQPLRKFSMPQPKRVVLANGMVIFLQEDHELPLINARATIRGGERNVAADKAGLVSIYTQSWRTGGTTDRTGDQLDEFLEARAARVETGGDTDSTVVTMDVLKADFDTVFPIWLDVLRNPAFREDKITLAKTQANTGISRRNDEVGSIVSREATKLGYGPDSPYARQPEYATIASITRDDLLAFHKRTVHPNNIIVALIGDFDSAQMEKRLRDTFGSWARGPQVEKPELPAYAPKPGVYAIAKDDVTQANIAMVHPGIQRNNPDYHAVQVMNEIFSGGFSGRLMQRLRSQRGLTYGVGGGIGANWDNPGLFRVQMATKSGTTHESIEALRGEVTALTNSPVTPTELALAKESILNAFIFSMDTRAKALNQQVLLEFYGFPADYFTRYPAEIQKVTAEDVQRVAKQYVHPDRLAVLVVGKEADFERPLSTLGTVTPIDITIPSPDAPKAGAAPAAGNAEGVALVNKVADFIGGKAKLEAMTSLRRSASLSTPQGEIPIEAFVQFPSSIRTEMKTPMGSMVRVVTPTAAFMVLPNGAQDMPGSMKEQSLTELKTDMFTVLRNIGNPKYTFTAGATEKVGDVDARILDINADGANARWYVELATGRVVRTVTRGAQGEMTADFSDWKTFGGINIPTKSTLSQNGQQAATVTLSNAEVNAAADANTFVKP